jgi:hypothetical protein
MKNLKQIKSVKSLQASSLTFRKKIFILIFFLMSGLVASAQFPTVTVRFTNPFFDCENLTYCVDVEFHSDTPNQQLFGINVRFYYDDSMLEFLAFGDYEVGYGPFDPNPPYIQTGPPTSGPAWFGFTGDQAEFVNGAVQLLYPPTSIVLASDPDAWTKIFNVCFTIDDPVIFENENFCPPLIWDLEEDPLNGGFMVGSDGVVILLVSPDPLEESFPANSNVDQFNWDYDGIPGTPYGFPENTDCYNMICDASDFGDAPEGASAYPNLGVQGQFPTCLDTVIAGFISHAVQDPITVFFGQIVDPEADGNAGLCSPYAPYNNDECFQDGDAGLIIPSPYTINGIGKYQACLPPGSPLANVADTVIWGPGNDLDILITNLSTNLAFVNLLIDWNLNGKWNYDPNTIVQGNVIPEHCLVNFPVPPGFTGPLSQLVPPAFYTGPLSGFAWARFSVTDIPVQQNWDGSGEFSTGETEDYLFKMDPRKEIPVADWALILGFLLISAFTIYRFRRI